MNKKFILKKCSIFLLLILIFISLSNISATLSTGMISNHLNRELLDYGNISVESSILNTLITQDKIIDIGIWIESKNDTINKIIKNKIIAELEGKFNLTWESNRENAFSGYLSKEGLKMLRNSSYPLVIHEITTGTILLDESVPLINADDVWAKGYSGKNQTICVIDTGVNASHPDLQGKVLAEKCYCRIPDAIFGSNFCCLGGVNESNDAEDNNGHGTHVTGIIVSQDATYRGVAPNASVVMVKITNSSGSWDDRDLEKAVQWCTNNKETYNISIITISLGTRTPILYNNTIDCEYLRYADDDLHNANTSGIFVDVASGNDYNATHISYPACVAGVISVGATRTTYDDIWAGTCRGNLLDLLAPGYIIQSLDYDDPNFPQAMYGTSQAAPHVAGAAALLLERDPTLTPDEIRDILNKTGKQIWDPESQRKYSRIDILNATNYLCVCSDWAQWNCGDGDCLSSERQYTRVCTDDCDTESKCEYSSSCTPGGGSITDVTVCASGCNYTSIDTAVRASKTNYRVYVVDDGSYNENVIMNSTTTEYLICQNGSRIYGNSNEGVRLKDVSSPVIVGCIIDGFDTGIYVEGTTNNGLIQNNTLINNDVGIYFKSNIAGMKMKYNNITGSTNYGIELYATTWSNGCTSNKIENNILKNNGDKEIYSIYGLYQNIQNNFISEGTSQGIHLTCSDTTSYASIYDNRIFNNGEGVYMQSSNNNILTNNTLCPSNTDADIHDTGTANGGSNNTCEKPGIWNDSGVAGCTYYCDTPAEVTLLFPPNSYEDTDGDIDLVCEADDDLQLANITLYHNVSGIWQANETRDINGTSNITTFTINNLANGTNFIWNCLAYDNKSRGGFASANWSVSVSIIPQDPHKFYIKNSSGDNVAWLGDEGNIALKGSCFSGENCNSPEPDSFIIRNITNNNVAYINSTGDLCLVTGDCSDESASCNPTRDAFIVRDSSDNNVSYIDFDGDLCLTRKLYENSGYV